jgi:hypothetical protein
MRAQTKVRDAPWLESRRVPLDPKCADVQEVRKRYGET